MSAPEPCTTWSYRLQHLSSNLDASYGLARTLCGVQAFTQAEVDKRQQEWAGRPPKKRVVDMPGCKKCAREAVAVNPEVEAK